MEEQRRRKAEYEARQQERQYHPNRQNSAGDYYSKQAADPYRAEQKQKQKSVQPAKSWPNSSAPVDPAPGQPGQEQTLSRPLSASTEKVLLVKPDKMHQSEQPIEEQSAVMAGPSVIGGGDQDMELLSLNKGLSRADVRRGIVMAEILGPCKAKSRHQGGFR